MHRTTLVHIDQLCTDDEIVRRLRSGLILTPGYHSGKHHHTSCQFDLTLRPEKCILWSGVLLYSEIETNFQDQYSDEIKTDVDLFYCHTTYITFLI